MKPPTVHVTAPDRAWLDRLKGVAADHGLSTSSFVLALVEGAIRKGITHSLVEVGGQHLPRLKATLRPDRWTQVARGHLTREGFTLRIHGSLGAHMKQGVDGWFLSGPDLPLRWVGFNRAEAVPEADALVDRKLAELHLRMEQGDPGAIEALEALTAPDAE